MSTNITPTLKKVFVTGGGSRLPSAYQEVEYLQSSGTQYIDMGVNASNLVKWSVNMMFTSSSVTQGFGRYDSNSFAWFFMSSRRCLVYYGSPYGGVSSISSTLNEQHEYILDGPNHAFYIDSTATVLTEKTFANTNSLYLLKCAGSGDGAIGNCYGSKIWNNSTLIRDFIPCYRKSDSVAGMYDLVNNTFYENAGTGSFIVGPDVYPKQITEAYKKCYVVNKLPAEYQGVEYLQSSGTQYINTNLTIPANTNDTVKYELKYSDASVNGNAIIFGAGTAPYAPSLFLNTTSVYSGVNIGYAVSDSTSLFMSYYTSGEFSFDLNFATKRATVVRNGTTIFSNRDISSIQTVPTNKITYLFALNKNGTASEMPTAVKLYYWRASINGTTMRDMVPCYRKSDSVAGMYDLVNNQFYTNQGTGTFIVGPDVNTLQIITSYKTNFVTN